MPKDAMLTIAISTLNERIVDIPSLVHLADVCKIMVVHQVSDGLEYSYRKLQADGVQVIRLTEAGLSLSRNCAIQACETPYCWFMDDDVVFDVQEAREFIATVKNIASPVVVCGHLNGEGLPAASYPRASRVLQRWQLAKFTSIDICVNVFRLREEDLQFDENFGLGTDLPGNEELIFLTDCFDNGLSVFFSRQYPVAHPGVDSGQDFYSRTELIDAKRESIVRVFKRSHFIVKCLFILKKIVPLVRARKLMFFSKRIFFTK